TTANSIELWVGDTTGATHKIGNVRVNEVMGGGGGGGGGRGGATVGGPVQWMGDNRSLLVLTVSAARGPAPSTDEGVPEGPHIQESLGGGRGIVTHEDMLQNPHD